MSTPRKGNLTLYSSSEDEIMMIADCNKTSKNKDDDQNSHSEDDSKVSGDEDDDNESDEGTEDESQEDEQGEADSNDEEIDEESDDYNEEKDDDDDDGEDNEDEEEEEGSDVEIGSGCQICLNPFIGQELGTPENCGHTFCLECIEEWSKNANNCPLDRVEFNHILVRNQVCGFVTRKVKVTRLPREPEDLFLEDTTECEVCHHGDREDRLLLCDACDLAYHCECLTPPLRSVPVSQWFCPHCSEIKGIQPSTPNRVRRTIPRTLVSETVRSRIQFQRTGSAPSTSSPRGIRKPPVKRRKVRRYRKRRTVKRKPKTAARTKGSASTLGKGKIATTSTASKPRRKMKRRRRRRKVKRRKTGVQRTKRSRFSFKKLAAPTAKGRIASRLGLCKPPPGHTMPFVKKSTSGLQAADGNVAGQVNLFGCRDQLMDFEENFTEENNANQPTSDENRCNVPSSVDLLGSIMTAQDRLHKINTNVIIGTDGSLRQNKDARARREEAKPYNNATNPISSIESGESPSSSSSSVAVLSRTQNKLLDSLTSKAKNKTSTVNSSPQQKVKNSFVPNRSFEVEQKPKTKVEAIEASPKHPVTTSPNPTLFREKMPQIPDTLPSANSPVQNEVSVIKSEQEEDDSEVKIIGFLVKKPRKSTSLQESSKTPSLDILEIPISKNLKKEKIKEEENKSDSVFSPSGRNSSNFETNQKTEILKDERQDKQNSLEKEPDAILSTCAINSPSHINSDKVVAKKTNAEPKGNGGQKKTTMPKVSNASPLERLSINNMLRLNHHFAMHNKSKKKQQQNVKKQSPSSIIDKEENLSRNSLVNEPEIEIIFDDRSQKMRGQCMTNSPIQSSTGESLLSSGIKRKSECSHLRDNIISKQKSGSPSREESQPKGNVSSQAIKSTIPKTKKESNLEEKKGNLKSTTGTFNRNTLNNFSQLNKMFQTRFTSPKKAPPSKELKTPAIPSTKLPEIAPVNTFSYENSLRNIGNKTENLSTQEPLQKQFDNRIHPIHYSATAQASTSPNIMSFSPHFALTLNSFLGCNAENFQSLITQTAVPYRSQGLSPHLEVQPAVQGPSSYKSEASQVSTKAIPHIKVKKEKPSDTFRVQDIPIPPAKQESKKQDKVENEHFQSSPTTSSIVKKPINCANPFSLKSELDKLIAKKQLSQAGLQPGVKIKPESLSTSTSHSSNSVNRPVQVQPTKPTFIKQENSLNQCPTGTTKPVPSIKTHLNNLPAHSSNFLQEADLKARMKHDELLQKSHQRHNPTSKLDIDVRGREGQYGHSSAKRIKQEPELNQLNTCKVEPTPRPIHLPDASLLKEAEKALDFLRKNHLKSETVSPDLTLKRNRDVGTIQDEHLVPKRIKKEPPDLIPSPSPSLQANQGFGISHFPNQTTLKPTQKDIHLENGFKRENTYQALNDGGSQDIHSFPIKKEPGSNEPTPSQIEQSLNIPKLDNSIQLQDSASADDHKSSDEKVKSLKNKLFNKAASSSSSNKVHYSTKELTAKIEEIIKNILHPFYKNRSLSKEDFKEVMRKCVPKVLTHSQKEGTLDEEKIHKLVIQYKDWVKSQKK